MSPALADWNNFLGNPPRNTFHCPIPYEVDQHGVCNPRTADDCTNIGYQHPVAEICSRGMILLDRTPRGSYTCGQCVTDTVALIGEYINAPIGSTFYSSNGDGGAFSFAGKNYYNGDGHSDAGGRRSNDSFCVHWFNAFYNHETRTCFCAPGLISEGNHGRCRLLTEADCEANEHFTPTPGNEGGICAPRTSTNCEEYYHFMPTPGDREGGTCEPRTADDCTTGESFRPAPLGIGGISIGGTCEPICGEYQIFTPTSASILDFTCEPRTADDCTASQTFMPAESSTGGTCEPRTTSSSGGGDGGGSGNGGAIALIAVPAVLIGGYFLLAPDFIDHNYEFSYSGINDNFQWSSSGTTSIMHDKISAHIAAVQSHNGLSYTTAAAYRTDPFQITYYATEHANDYNYEFAANAYAELGPWNFSPTAAAELQYETDTNEWTSQHSLGFTVAWHAYLWDINANSNFAFGSRSLSIEMRRQF